MCVFFCFQTCVFSVHAGLSNRNTRPAGKAPSVSLNWSCSDGVLEEVSTVTGRRKDSMAPSRLCRRTMFSRSLRLQQQVSLNLFHRSILGPWRGSKKIIGRLVSAFWPQGSVILLLFQLGSSFGGTEVMSATYDGSKLAARRYQRALWQFVSALQAAGLGAWPRKPPEPNHPHQ